MSDVSTQSGGPKAAPSTGKKNPIEPLTDQFGNEVEMNLDRYPEGSPGKEGSATRPSGQGGATPKSRPDHQDMWPANPPPSESAAAKGEENDRVATGDTNSVQLANERLAAKTGVKPEDQTKRGAKK